MTLKCGCEGDVCQGHMGKMLDVNILTEIPCKELWALQQVARKAKTFINSVREPPEPTNLAKSPVAAHIFAEDLNQALRELENYWKIEESERC